MKSFSYDASPARIVFGQGTIREIAEEVRRLGRSRVMVLASRRLDALAADVTESLGDMAVVRFDGAVMHTPTEVTTAALKLAETHHVDIVVAIGGGSATGLSKALALRAGVDQIIVPTTYAGSEVTPVLGETDNGRKTTRSSPHIRPETVIYDVDLTLDLPLDTTVTSAVNAMAHAVEALYSTESNPITDLMAIEAISGIARALPSIVDDPKKIWKVGPNYCKQPGWPEPAWARSVWGFITSCATPSVAASVCRMLPPTPLSFPRQWRSTRLASRKSCLE